MRFTFPSSLALTVAFVSCAHAAKNFKFSEIVTFGESLSDDGSNARPYIQKNFPFFPDILAPPDDNGRACNGPVWVEYLAQMYGAASNNVAFAGSLTNTLNSALVYVTQPDIPSLLALPNLLEVLLPDLSGQFAVFLQRRAQSQNSRALVNRTSTSLYIVLSGANDIALDDNYDAADTIDAVNTTITKLKRVGAKYFLLPDYPDFSLLPASSIFTPDQKVKVKQFTVNYHNSIVALAKLHNAVFFSLNDFFNDAIKNPAKYGILPNLVNTPCWPGGSQNKTTCSNPEQYLYWDLVHPVTTFQQKFAAAAKSTLDAHDFNF